MELWKEIKGYEGLYEVSDLGNVRSLIRLHPLPNSPHKLRKYGGNIIVNYINKRGYVLSSLCKNGKKTTKRTHILVATAFIPNPINVKNLNNSGTICTLSKSS